MFMHFGLMHILNNMVVLGAVGQIVEKAMGHVKLLIIFLVSGMCGSVLSYIVMLIIMTCGIGRRLRGDIWSGGSTCVDSYSKQRLL